MTILDELENIVTQAWDQGYYLPVLSLNPAAFKEFLEIPASEFNVDVGDKRVQIVCNNHSERITAPTVLQMQK